MYELGAIIFPNDLLELAMVHNRSFFPLDSKARGYSFEPGNFFLHFSSNEDMGKRPIPLSMGDNGELNVGGPLLEKPLPAYHSIAISWGQIFRMLKQHAIGVPADADLLEVQVKQANGQGEIFHCFRLLFRTEKKDGLTFLESGQAKDLYIKPTRVEGEATGALRYVGAAS